jgi:hypothetical protein
MTTEPTVTTDQPGATGTAAPRPRPRTDLSPRRPWLVGALLLSGAGQLITISALLSVDPLAATWWALLLAIAPAPLAGAAAYAPAPLSRLAAVAGVAVLIAGIAGQATQTGWEFVFFFPALVILAVGGVKLWREKP